VTAPALALLRASWFQARSYRLQMAMQVGSLILTVVPTYFIATALQPMMEQSISAEAEQFFAFVLVGSIALMMVTASMSTLPSAISSGIASGYFESLLMTKTRLPSLLAGMSSYGLLVTFVRSAIMLGMGWLLGARVAWALVGPATLILALIVVAHWGIGLIASALIVAFRTYGPLLTGVTILSTLFGGVYYPVKAIPSWLESIAAVTPLAYGTRVLRDVLLQGDAGSLFSADVGVLVAFAVLLLIVGGFSMQAALRYARKAGTLGTY
jgi:ABC-type polysaccharide/polyol phosphate export permease